jgi:hypothetical protein
MDLHFPYCRTDKAKYNDMTTEVVKILDMLVSNKSLGKKRKTKQFIFLTSLHETHFVFLPAVKCSTNTMHIIVAAKHKLRSINSSRTDGDFCFCHHGWDPEIASKI